MTITTCSCKRRTSYQHRPDEQCGTGAGVAIVAICTIVGAGIAAGQLLAIIGRLVVAS